MFSTLLANKQLFKWVLFAAVIVISVGSFSQGMDSPINNDKLEHYSAFLGLAFIAHRAMRAGFAVQMVVLLGYGAWIELVQYFLPYRSSAMNDFMADIAGVCTYHALYQIHVWASQYRFAAKR